MAAGTQKRRYPGVKVKPLEADFSDPMYACEIVWRENPQFGDPRFPDAPERIGVMKQWMAFDPYYGPESEAQIEWHKANGTPGANEMVVGERFTPKRGKKYNAPELD